MVVADLAVCVPELGAIGTFTTTTATSTVVTTKIIATVMVTSSTVMIITIIVTYQGTKPIKQFMG
jgi:hypothetical protein